MSANPISQTCCLKENCNHSFTSQKGPVDQNTQIFDESGLHVSFLYHLLGDLWAGDAPTKPHLLNHPKEIHKC